ncbi:MAG: hypothetical protein ABMB14_07485 [Myxococcota bacterium]
MELKQWLRQNGAWLFGTALDAYRPGYIFRKVHPLFGASRFDYVDTAWNRLGTSKDAFGSVDASAMIPTGTWSQSFESEVDVTLAQLGLTIGAGASSIRSVSLVADGLRAVTIDDALFTPISLVTSLRPAFADESGRFFVAHTLFYADRFQVTFEVNGGASADATLTNLQASAGGGVTWHGGSTVSYGGPNVPFAFVGLPVK